MSESVTPVQRSPVAPSKRVGCGTRRRENDEAAHSGHSHLPPLRDKRGDTPLHRAAAENGNPAIVAELVSWGADANAKMAAGRTPLHEAAANNGNPAVVAALLEAGAEVDARGTDEEVGVANPLADRLGFLNAWGQEWEVPSREGLDE